MIVSARGNLRFGFASALNLPVCAFFGQKVSLLEKVSVRTSEQYRSKYINIWVEKCLFRKCYKFQFSNNYYFLQWLQYFL